MSCEEDLYKVITEELRTGGHLNRLQGEVRNKVLELLGRHWGVSLSSNVPEPPSQILLLNQAIKEYLEWMGYTHSSSIFSAESGTTEDKSMILALKTELGLQHEESQNVLPILMSVFTAIINS